VRCPDNDAFMRFIERRKKDIERISKHTRGECTAAAVISTAWIVATEIGESREGSNSLDDPEFEQLLLSYLYQRLIRYTNRRLRYAISLDQKDSDDGTDRYNYLGISDGDSSTDPLTQLLVCEEASARSARYPNPYESPASGYAHLLREHDNSFRRLAEFLRISLSYCYHCYNKAHRLAAYQLSLPMMTKTDRGEDLVLKPWRTFRLVYGHKQRALNLEGQPALL
jgi:hypothetical protein